VLTKALMSSTCRLPLNVFIVVATSEARLHVASDGDRGGVVSISLTCALRFAPAATCMMHNQTVRSRERKARPQRRKDTYLAQCL
jgi:hypothetical protein